MKKIIYIAFAAAAICVAAPSCSELPSLDDNGQIQGLTLRFTTGSMIIDADTGDQYMLREVEHFPIDQCFWIHGQPGETIRFVLVYPPLPLSVKRIEFYEAPAESHGWLGGDARRTTTITLEELRPNHQDSQVDTTKQGRIIR